MPPTIKLGEVLTTTGMSPDKRSSENTKSVQSEIGTRASLSEPLKVENVDGVDFQRYFVQLNGTEHAIHQSLEKRTCENGVSEPNTRIEKTEPFKNAKRQTEHAQATGIQGQPRNMGHEVVDNTNHVRHETGENPSIGNNDTETEASEIERGLVDYLYDKAKQEIMDTKFDTAKRYLDRISTMSGAEDLAMELKNTLITRAATVGYSSLPVLVLDVVIEMLIELRNDASDSAKAMLETRILDACYASGWLDLQHSHPDDNISRPAFAEIEIFSTIWNTIDLTEYRVLKDEIVRKMDEKALNFYLSGLFDDASLMICDMYAKEMNDVAHTTAHYIAMLTFQKVIEACEEHQRNILVQQEDEKRFISYRLRQTAKSLLEEIHCGDCMIEFMIDPTCRPTLAEFKKNPSIGRRSRRSSLRFKPRDRNYSTLNGIFDELLSLRDKALGSCALLFGNLVVSMIASERWGYSWVALRCLFDFNKDYKRLEAIWEGKTWLRDRYYQDFYNNAEVRKWAVLGCHVAARLRKWHWFSIPEMSGYPTKVQQMESELQFLYHLSYAELAYFHTRDLDLAKLGCQQALKFNGAQLCSSPRLDAIYLLQRVLIRQNLPLDAEYYQSLIPSDYSEWRIYGEPGKLLDSLGIQISKGQLRVKAETLQQIVNATLGNECPREFSDFPLFEFCKSQAGLIVQGLFADDIGWTRKMLTLKVFTSDFKVQELKGNALHLYAMTRKEDELRIALGNPWVDVDRKCENGQTPLHYATFNGLEPIIGMLLERGASVDARDHVGNTPMHNLILAMQSAKDTNDNLIANLKLLLGKKPKTNLPNIHGSTLLHRLTVLMRNEMIALSTIQEFRTLASAKVEVKIIDKLQLYYAATEAILEYSRTSGKVINITAKDAYREVAFDETLYQSVGKELEIESTETLQLDPPPEIQEHQAADPRPPPVDVVENLPEPMSEIKRPQPRFSVAAVFGKQKERSRSRLK